VSPEALDLPSELNDAFLILFVHQLSEQKGTPYLVDAFEEFQQEVADTVLILVGTDRLEDQRTQKKIERNNEIVHIQRVPHREMSDLYNLADIFVLPSVTMESNEEQFGMALIEAMACGTPSVVTDVGGLPHVARHKETSLVVEEKSVSPITDALRAIYDNKNMYQQFIVNSRQRAVEKYSTPVVAEKLYDFYTTIIEPD